jgi:hypothetical protein
MTGLSSKSYWHLSRTLATQTGMTNDWLKSQGRISVRDLWCKRMAVPEIVACSLLVNRLVRTLMRVVWGGGLNTRPYPIMCCVQAEHPFLIGTLNSSTDFFDNVKVILDILKRTVVRKLIQ